MPNGRWTTAVSMTVEGEYGRSYSFYSVAYDYVGWQQLPPFKPQTVTFVPPYLICTAPLYRDRLTISERVLLLKRQQIV
jgi:hypothetical protein